MYTKLEVIIALESDVTQIQVESMKFSSFNPKGADVELLIFDLKNAESRRRGFNTVKEEQLKGIQHRLWRSVFSLW